MVANNKKLFYALIGYMIISSVFLFSTRPVGAILLNLNSIEEVKGNVTSKYSDVSQKVTSNSKIDVPMTIFKPNENQLELYSLLKDGNILITKFAKKSWGTWNIDGWYLARDDLFPSKEQSLLAGGGSDWEYTFRVAQSPNESYIFSGGNHGNEIFKDIKFINDETNKELDLKIGQKYTVGSLKIIEKTVLTSDVAMTKPYANVTRDYTITHGEIKLTNDIEFINNIYMGLSYVCMMPIEKKVGRCIKFNDASIIYTSPDVGETFSTYTKDYFLGKESTLSVEIWNKAIDKYKFFVWIADAKMVDGFNNSMKTFFWDVNKAGNKVYFSKFDNEEHKKIQKGTKWHNEQGWGFKVN